MTQCFGKLVRIRQLGVGHRRGMMTNSETVFHFPQFARMQVYVVFSVSCQESDLLKQRISLNSHVVLCANGLCDVKDVIFKSSSLGLRIVRMPVSR